MFYRMQSFFTIFLISVLLLSFGTFAEADDASLVIQWRPNDDSTKPIIFGKDDDFKMKKNIRTGEREWIGDNPKVSISVAVWAYGIGDGQGYLEDITILGNHYEEETDRVYKVGYWGEDKGTGWYDKGSGYYGVYCTTTERFDEIPVDEVKDSYEWDAKGYIILTAKKWETTVNENTSYAWPLQVKATFGKSGKWVDAGFRKRWARSKKEGEIREHTVTYKEYDPLSVSFNKTDFTADETLEVTVKIEGVRWAYLQVGNQFPLSITPTSSDTIKVSSGLSHLLSETNQWYDKVYGTVLFKSDGKMYFAYFDQYISVRQPEAGFFPDGYVVGRYGTYNAKVVDTRPIKKVIWSIKKPGGEWEEVETDEVNGGLSASLSWTAGGSEAKPGLHYVKAEVHFETNATTYSSYFTVVY